MKRSALFGPFLFPLPAATPAQRRRNKKAHYLRRSPGYCSADRCYNAIEAVVNALRHGARLSPRRQRELGVSTPAEFVWRLRRHFRRLKRIYRVNRLRELLDHYGKRKGCWQFHHHETPYRVRPDDESAILARCHVSNIEPVTWQENINRRYAVPAESPGDWLPGL